MLICSLRNTRNEWRETFLLLEKAPFHSSPTVLAQLAQQWYKVYTSYIESILTVIQRSSRSQRVGIGRR